jgi:excinuclease ABC subunit A
MASRKRKLGTIHVRGARQNNLKGFDVEIPHEQLTVVTGVSGSGKSSLAFQTLYAEGQRRYSESFSAYVRQFLEKLPRPRVDAIDGMLPAIAIEQQSATGGGRSTVATLTDLADYLKLLYARGGVLHCPGCGEPVHEASALTIRNTLLQEAAGARAVIAFPVHRTPGQEVVHRLADLTAMGYTRRVSWDGGFGPLSGPPTVAALDASALEAEQLWIVADRLSLERRRAPRLLEAVEQALEVGGGAVAVLVEGTNRAWRAERYATGYRCQRCERTFASPTPNLFSYNSPVGACERCNGFGRVMDIDWDLVIPDAGKTLKQGAIRPWSTPKTRYERRHLAELCEAAGIAMDVPWRDLPDEARCFVIEGDEETWGVRDWFEWLESRTYRTHVRILLARYRAYRTCPACGGSRLRPEALAYRVAGRTLAEVYAMEIAAARRFFDELTLPADRSQALAPVLGEIRGRLSYLELVGVDYLTLDRQARTLSGGEAQRVTLTTALGAALVHTLFVLDEPTVGLHPRDTARLLAILRRLTDRGNTCVVVEHDPDVIRAADHLVDLGPGAGEAGGQLIHSGPPGRLPATSTTARMIKRRGRLLDTPPPRRTGSSGSVHVLGAGAHNLADIDVELPLGTLTCVTGVSGSGKSTLTEHVIYRGVARRMGRPLEAPGPHRGIEGWEALEDVVYVDQTPAASSPRATPLTYVGVFDRVRQLYARTPEAEAAGLNPGSFSWNTAGGRCEACEGAGVVRVELHFLPDALVPCEVCEGRRFNPDVLAVRWRDHTLHEVLALTVTEALELFADQPRVRRGLAVLQDVGLGYLRLGQGLNTLSGGENQRLKVARHLAPEKNTTLPARRSVGPERTTSSLFILDEPTRGLHLADVSVLVQALHALVDRGNTVLVVEHHPEVVWQADHVIDLGPEGGAGGGRVVVAGPPEAVRAAKESHTGRFLDAYLGNSTRAAEKRPAYRRKPTNGHDITLQGARLHNLQDLDLSIPRDRLVVLTGPSGSGKSSVAFDILHAEGQRRFLDCLSPYARQYMKQLSRPDIDALRDVPPTIAVEQRLTRGRQMSTVATLTEVYPYLRLLYAKTGTVHCEQCGAPTTSARPEEIIDEVLRRFDGRRARLLAPVLRQRKGWHETVLDRARKLGLEEVRVDGKLRPLEGPRAPTRLARYRLHDIDFVLADGRVRTSTWRPLLHQALDLGRGTFSILPAGSRAAEQLFGTDRVCRRCRLTYPPPDPRLFSFTAAQGACPACDGTGLAAASEHKRGGAGGVVARADGGKGGKQRAERPPSTPKQYCPACEGARLRPAALTVTLGERSIADVHAMLPGEAARFLEQVTVPSRLEPVIEPVRREIATRLGFLETVGLGYLGLDRPASTLSGGEVQRLRLAAHLSAPLHGVLYILDEPTIGLHPEDHDRLLQVLLDLRRARNTVLIVEHDEATMEAADHLIDLGPGGGHDGGRLVDSGTPAQVRRRGRGLTARLLRREVGQPALAATNGSVRAGSGGERKGGQEGQGPRAAHLPSRERQLNSTLSIHGASAHNLRDIDIEIPTGALTVLTGRSGSGKSTLMRHVLLATAEEEQPTGCSAIRGLERFQRVVEVDQEPIGRNPRSCPATYVGVMNHIRQRFAALPEARVRGFGPGRFSFNVEGGRCPHCDGHGWLTVEMGFLPDAHVPCPRCDGRRYHHDTLAIRMGGKSVADVLSMTAAEAAGFFASDRRINRALDLFVEIGLGYLPLGQPSPTLSGGEAQRIKLIEELSKRNRGQTLFLLDEPTTGLHGADVERLVKVLRRLVDRGHTVVVIEHHLAVIAQADHVVDLGPGAGPEGGDLLYQGTPAQLAARAGRLKKSATGRWLRQYLG